MNPTTPKVVEVTAVNVQTLVAKHRLPGLDLGAKMAELGIHRRIVEHREKGGKVFLIHWLGNKVPHGAEILGHIVTWAAKQVVVSESTQIGTFDRLITFGGPGKNVQLILVYASPQLGR